MSAQKYSIRKSLEEDLLKIRREEEVKWFQRAKDKDLVQGEALTSYFMAKASGRKRKNKISFLQQEEGLTQGDREILLYSTKFYRAFWSYAR